MKLAKNQVNAKQHAEAELLLFENYSHSSSTLSKNNKRYFKNFSKNKCVGFDDFIWLLTMKMRLKMKNKSQRYDLNRPRPRRGHKYTKYKMCLSEMMVICTK